MTGTAPDSADTGRVRRAPSGIASALAFATTPRAAQALALATFGCLLVALHGVALRLPFLADDYIFLDEARAGLGASLVHAYTVVPGYFRPIGRELYFWALDRAAHDVPLVGHVTNLLLVLGVATLVAALAGRIAGARAGWIAGGVYVLLYSQRVVVGYVSGAQDAFAALLGVAAALLFTRGRHGWAAAVFGAALLAKESVGPLPLALLVWVVASGSGRRVARLRHGLASTWPMFLVAALWVLAVPILRARVAGVDLAPEMNPLHSTSLGLPSLVEGLRSALLACVGLEQPLEHLGRALGSLRGAALAVGVAIAAGFAAARVGARTGASSGGAEGRAASAARLAWLGAAWLLLGSLALAPVADRFSAYYVTFSGVGFAMLAGAAAARVQAPIVAIAFGLLAAVNVVANATGLYRLQPGGDAPPGASYYSFARLASEAEYSRALRAVLEAHRPPRGAVVYLSQPLGFSQMGTAGERAPRLWLDDPALNIRFTDRYTPRGERPVAILRWDRERAAFDPFPTRLMDLIWDGERLMALGNHLPARAALRGAMALADSVRHAAEREEVENTLGLAELRLGDTTAALGAWQHVTRRAPGHRGALLNLAAVSAGRADWTSAWRFTNRTLEAHPDDPLALLYLSRIEMARGETARSREAWSRLVAVHPSFAESLVRSRPLRP